MSTSVRCTPVSGVPLLVLAGVLWGTGGLLGSTLAGATGLSPLAVATYRLAAGGLLLCGYLGLTGRRVPARRDAWSRVAATGGLAALFQASYFTAVGSASVGLATLVAIGSAPVFVLVAQWRRGGVDRRSAGSAGVALLGLGLIVGIPTMDGAGVLVGALFAVLAGAGFAALTLLAARPVEGLDAPTTTGVGFTVGGIVLVPLAALSPSGLGFDPQPGTVGLLLALGAVPTALAYTAYFRGLRSSSPGVAAVVALLEPLTAATLAALLLGERLGVAGTAGAVLLAVAVAVIGTGPATVRPRCA